MAIPLRGRAAADRPPRRRGDLDAGLLRVLHPRSFEDDPTRAIRAARYAARASASRSSRRPRELLRRADLDTVSADRREAELLRLAAEADGAARRSRCSPSGA